LCHLFQEDESVEMTPILRQSKESARRQRSKPLNEETREGFDQTEDIPLSISRPLPERPRKRRGMDEEYIRPKASRPHQSRSQARGYPQMTHQGPSTMLVSRYATSGSIRSSERSYEEYLRVAERQLPDMPVRQNFDSPRSVHHYHPYAYGRPDLPKPFYNQDRRGIDRGGFDDFYARSNNDRPRIDRARKFNRR